MEPQLLTRSPESDFNFDSTPTSCYATAPSTPRIYLNFEDDEEDDHIDFAFEFSGQLKPRYIPAADELFQAGKIKPLEQPQTLPSNNEPPSRPLSPLRVSDILSQDQEVETNQSSMFGFMWYNKWNLKNLLLFRSEGRGENVEPLKTDGVVTKGEEDVKNSSFRSCDSGGSVSGSSRRRMKRKVSAHEIHYTANRAVTEEMRRKTFLPYKSGLLGCIS